MRAEDNGEKQKRAVVRMANEKNLKPIRSKSEAREKGKKGGRKSGKVRREKRLLKDCMLELLDLPVAEVEEQKKLASMGLDAEKIDNRALLTSALFLKGASGDVAAFKEIKELIGEQKTETNGIIEELIEDLKDG